MRMLPFRPIVSALRRHPLMPLLVAVQVALTCAILANAIFLLQRQVAPLLIDDGIPRDRLFLVDNLVARHGNWNAAQIRTGTEALRAVPGVEAVAPALGLPMKQTLSFNLGLRGPTGTTAVSSGFAGDGLREALGLELVQGRDFLPGESATVDLGGRGVDIPSGTPVILTAALARFFFPDGDALGGRLEQTSGDRHLVVVGIVRRLLRYEMGELDDGRANFSILLPARIQSTPVLNYAVLIDTGHVDGIEGMINEVLDRTFGSLQMPGIGPRVDRFEDLRTAAFRSRRAAVWLLSTVIVVVLLVSGIGIASLSGYWVEQRTRTIGVRRALGASRADILRHFLAENFIVISVGIVPGLIGAYAVNQWLMQHYAMARLPLAYLPAAAIALWALGQIAVFGPARRAAAVPPAVATRSV
ncbi:MAG TPA: FtsX-like permease family protein [Lysobacter sp.]|nr:FtsX-like permease family protein [Lysobacter sp.]